MLRTLYTKTLYLYSAIQTVTMCQVLYHVHKKKNLFKHFPLRKSHLNREKKTQFKVFICSFGIWKEAENWTLRNTAVSKMPLQNNIMHHKTYNRRCSWSRIHPASEQNTHMRWYQSNYWGLLTGFDLKVRPALPSDTSKSPAILLMRCLYFMPV